MTPFKEFLTSAVERLLFRSAVVSESIALAGHFRQVVVQGEDLKDVKWISGQKVQFHLGNLMTRTYTPVEWDSVTGCARFLLFLHGNGPGSEWASTLGRGDRCQLIGPRDSLNFAVIEGPLIFFGDETSFAAAHALHLARPGLQKEYFFEVSSLVESEEVLRCIGLTNAQLFQRLPDDAHLHDIESGLVNRSWRLGLPHWVLTGKAQSIQVLRRRLQGHRAFFHKPRIRAYWAEGKAALD
jgi:NADPH-dependent ferric siderophore reductase